MRMPDALASLTEYGIIDEVLRPLMSGKEAQVYLVRSDGEYRVAKVYKEAQNRTFKNRADYTEGRKVRNTRDQRAMGKGSRHGRAQTEAAWRTTEVDMIYRLRDAGVRVPTPYHFIDGVLVMEMITDAVGDPAPRLGDVMLELEGAQAVFDLLLAEVVRMLAAGVVHGDLSDFNVLMGTDGPVIIDFPQAVDASSNQNARKLLLRDVDNLHRYMARFVPDRRAPPYAQEMWALYERGQLLPDTKLTGRYQAAERKVSTEAVLDLIGDATRDERRRREKLGLSMRGAPEDAPAGAAHAEQDAARPPSKYAQKREALIAARRLEAASQPKVASHPAGHARAASHSASHTKAASHPASHARAASHPASHAKGASHPASHAKGASHPASHAKGASHPASHAKAASHTKGAGHPTSHAKGVSHAASHVKAASHPKPQATPQRDPRSPEHRHVAHKGAAPARSGEPRPNHAKAPAQHDGSVAGPGAVAEKRRRRRRRRKGGLGEKLKPLA
jgi:RIO kinase 1